MQFKGMAASAGQITGKVCVLRNADEFSHCTQDHVALLVGVKPNAVLGKTVKAILSVHGSITSHAAIVARENNKPAIVGLPEAILQSVKDGDMVEVNANKGVVRTID